jgi:hypothetical protein
VNWAPKHSLSIKEPILIYLPLFTCQGTAQNLALSKLSPQMLYD